MKFDEVKLEKLYVYPQNLTDWTVFYKKEKDKLFYIRFLIYEGRKSSMKGSIIRRKWDETHDGKTYKFYFIHLLECNFIDYKNFFKEMFK